MRRKLLSTRQGPLVGASLLACVLLGWGLVGSVAGVEIEVAREMRYSDDFGEQAKAAFAEMVQDLVQNGCKTARAYAYSKEGEVGVVVVAARCLEWHDPAKW